jgi:hypothetical protein
MDFDFIVGNPPFTSARGKSKTGVKKIGNDFIRLMNRLSKKSIYVLHAKLDSPTFYTELIQNPALKKIVFHKEKEFNIGDKIYTAHVYVDNETHTDTFIYTDNIGSEELILPKSSNTILSPIVSESFVIDPSKRTLADLWIRGKKTKSKLSGQGRYEVITNIGKNDSDELVTMRDDEESTSYGKWKIVFSVGARNKMKIAGPQYSIIQNIVALSFDTEEQCRAVFDWINNTGTNLLFDKFRTSSYNNKVLFQKFVLPDEILKPFENEK